MPFYSVGISRTEVTSLEFYIEASSLEEAKVIVERNSDQYFHDHEFGEVDSIYYEININTLGRCRKSDVDEDRMLKAQTISIK